MLYQSVHVYGVRSAKYDPRTGSQFKELALDLKTSTDEAGTWLLRIDLTDEAAAELMDALRAALYNPGRDIRPGERIEREEADVIDSVDTAGLVNR